MGCSTTIRRIICAAFLGLWALAAHAGAIEVRDDRGVLLNLPASPQRIVTLLPSLTESVCALGACDRLVGTDRYSNSPTQVQTLPKLGGLEDAQVERIVALKPDVVLIETTGRVIDRLESLGVKVFALDAKTHADVKRTLGSLGRMLDVPQAADAVWSRIEADLAAAASRIPATTRGQRIYFEIDSTPYAAGVDSFIGETLARLSMGNIVPAGRGAFPRLNPEFVVKARPDIVMASQANLADMPRRPGWATLPALRDHRSCGFDLARIDVIVRPGPRMGEAAMLLAQCLAALPNARP